MFIVKIIQNKYIQCW